MSKFKKKPTIITNYGIFYSQKRLILLNYNNFKIKRKIDINRLIAHICLKFKKRNLYIKYFYLFNDLAIKADAFHFFNTVTSSKKHWIVTLEADFDRYSNKYFNPFKYVLNENCRYILPYSQWAKKNQLSKLKDEELKQKLAQKMKVVYPPQEVLVDKPQQHIQEPIKFVLIGTSFFRKGGYEALKVFEKLHQEGYQFQFTIVSSLSRWDYPINTPEEKYDEVLHHIKTKHYINYYDALPNEQVLQLIKSHHVGLLLSHMETFGYFVLECQASGVPVVTTNQRAFLETNAEDRGWFVEVPVNSNLSIEYDTPPKRKFVQQTIEQGFYEVAKSILNHPDQIPDKSANSLAYIKKKHCPETYKKTVGTLYNEITTAKLRKTSMLD